MSVGLDTSVVMRLLTGEPETQATVALAFLGGRRVANDPVLVSDLVIADVYYALQYHYELSKREALNALRSFLSTPGVECTGNAAEILDHPKLESAKPGFIDRLIHTGYVGAAADRLITFEQATAKLPHVQVLAVG